MVRLGFSTSVSDKETVCLLWIFIIAFCMNKDNALIIYVYWFSCKCVKTARPFKAICMLYHQLVKIISWSLGTSIKKTEEKDFLFDHSICKKKWIFIALMEIQKYETWDSWIRDIYRRIQMTTCQSEFSFHSLYTLKWTAAYSHYFSTWHVNLQTYMFYLFPSEIAIGHIMHKKV